MCGRFTLKTPLNQLLLRFQLPPLEWDYTPRYNIAPTQKILTVVNTKGKPKVVPMRWGLIPYWAKESRIGAKMINARQETLTEKVSFRNLVDRKRCLILADGFYEWTTKNSAKIPMYITLREGYPFAMAGLWDTWKQPHDEPIYSCTIITTNANELLSPIHHRMPVILRPDHEEMWLSSAPFSELINLLEPYPSDLMHFYQVSTLVNSPKNDIPECIAQTTH